MFSEHTVSHLNRRRGRRSLSSRLCLELAVGMIVALLLAGCDRMAGEDEAKMHTRPFDSIFPLARAVDVETTAEHPIGLVNDGAVTEDGSVFLADVSMREVKAFNSDGSPREIVGAVGQGPGEYQQPVSVDVIASRAQLWVADPVLGRAVAFTVDDAKYTGEYINLDGPVTLHSIRFASPERLIVAGIPGDYGFEDDPETLAVLSLSDSTWTRTLPIPEPLQQKAAGGSVLKGLVSVRDSSVFAAIRGHPTIYRLAADGSKKDSMRLPPQVFPGVELPDPSAWDGGVAALREFVRTQPWIQRLVALPGGERVVVKIDEYEPDEESWMNLLVLMDFARRSIHVSDSSCQCFPVGSHGDSLVVLMGEAGSGFSLEWRTIIGKESRVEGADGNG